MKKNIAFFLTTVCLILCISLFLASCPANGLPDDDFNWLTESATESETTITLTIKDRITLGSTEKWGSLQVVITGNTNPLTEGDQVDLQVNEDDIAMDIGLWQQDFTVNVAEASANQVDRTFDVEFLAAADDDSTVNVLEVYAQAEVDKDSSMIDETPVTSSINIQLAD